MSMEVSRGSRPQTASGGGKFVVARAVSIPARSGRIRLIKSRHKKLEEQRWQELSDEAARTEDDRESW